MWGFSSLLAAIGIASVHCASHPDAGGFDITERTVDGSTTSMSVSSIPSLTAAALPIQWLHIAKAGSTFANSVYRVACSNIPSKAAVDCGAPITALTLTYPPSEYCKGGFIDNSALDGHHSVQSSYHGHLVGNFRDPHKLKKSILNYMILISSNKTWDEECFQTSATEEQLVSFLSGDSDQWATNASPNIVYKVSNIASQAVANKTKRCSLMKEMLPYLQGCQSKMLVGAGCLSTDGYHAYKKSDTCDDVESTGGSHPQAVCKGKLYHGSEVLYKHAAEVLPSQFQFVGNTDSWTSSSCAFRYLYSDNPDLNEVEFEDARPSPVDFDWDTEAMECGVHEQLVEDYADDLLYTRAKLALEKVVKQVKARSSASKAGYEACIQQYGERI